MTLPESTLARLASIDPDRARAIAKVTDAAMPPNGKREKQIELVEATPGLAIIIVGPSQLLQKIKWLRLVEVAPMRFLLSIPLGTSIDSLELAIIELLEDAKPYDDWEHSLLSHLRDLLRRLRHSGRALEGGDAVHRHTGHGWFRQSGLAPFDHVIRPHAVAGFLVLAVANSLISRDTA